MIPLPSIDGFTIRESRDSDSAAIGTLIARCYAEYPGCVMDPEGEDADLGAPHSAFASVGGTLWVVCPAAPSVGESVGIVACVGVRPMDSAGVFELKRLYVARSARRRGIAGALFALVEHTARARGGTRLILWSDTRFTEAHRFYESHECARGHETRELHDPSNTVEYFYSKPLSE